MTRHDPAPSRMAYRMQRLLLTPLFRLVLRVGVPFALAFGGGTLWFSNQSHRDELNMMVSDLRAKIEQRPEFMVKLMAIDGASDGVAEDIREILPLYFPVSSFDLNLDKMRDTITELDAVKSASVRIKSGGVLQVDVEERIPVIIWRGREGLELIDIDGVLVGPTNNRTDWPNLPVMAGEVIGEAAAEALQMLRAAEAEGEQARAELQETSPEVVSRALAAQATVAAAVPEALALIEAAHPLRDRLRGLVRVGARRWDVVLDRDQRILLPDENPVQALERVIALDQALDMLSRDLVAVDLRLPHRPTLRMTDFAQQEMWRIKAIEVGEKQR
ncbi:cell division protein FtsQ/DivIB [Mesobacterium sp. TK19101]|uniref:Cell division protein FtsQ n=1 Tax=Mesobacterium hydrothermale TaxID=3111907 RepID=A0ABU6HKI6_9RHOB|nr:cell division protein FtsQ/DivIB [Mesobacterium sp. TK19101]MEC3861953.1 cell division protein FtsQ/DivIB [Mesobacterium sp. TK19101]